jgi:hypothetical protein
MPKPTRGTTQNTLRRRDLQKALLAILEAQRAAFADEHRLLARDAQWRRRAALLGAPKRPITSGATRASVATERSSLIKEVTSRSAAPLEPRMGHNPVRYAPFDFTVSQLEPSPLPSAVSPTLFGPDAATGQIGSILGLGESDAEAMTLSSRVGVGYTQLVTRGTYLVVAQAGLRGSVYIDTLGQSQYAEAYAGLRLSVTASYISRGNLVTTGRVQVTTDIAFLSAPAGVLDSRTFGSTANITGDSRTVTLLISAGGRGLQLFRSLLISVEAIQSVTSDHATAGCQLEMMVGPVAVIRV